MNDNKFEVAFSGEIAEGADLEQVKARVGQMFKADAAKIAHLFSGKRMVIKKDIDQQTAAKYKAALNKAGALCEVKNLSAPPASAADIQSSEVEKIIPSAAPTLANESGNIKTTAPEIAIDTPDAPNTDPLHISASDIEDLSASLADAGSNMQDEIQQVAEPEVDISGLDMAPAGSVLMDEKEADAAPQLDTAGLKIVD